MKAWQLPNVVIWTWIAGFLGLAAGYPAWGHAEADCDDDELPTVSKKIEGMEKRDGLLNTYFDSVDGRIWLELPAPRDETGEILQVIYYEGLRRGLGSNPVGLDRGQLGESHLLTLRRLGPTVLFEQPNLRFRASSDRLSERRATADSFATSVLWGGRIGALDPSGRSLVDLTPFLVRDAHGTISTLAETGQGEFTLDLERSAIDFANCLSFPDNLEFEAILTFAGTDPGDHVRNTAPSAKSVTLVQHQSFVRLPDDGYQPRDYDPRVGVFNLHFQDYAVPLDESIDRRWIIRHRLEKVDPAAARSRVIEPLVYYVDPGAPEPVRSALIEGASWWTEAFEKAGFIDAFRVEVLPEGAHPLDVRYNVIQWVHRSTRGWSYGGGIQDPRTGETLKGHVTLGSLRVRQDRLLFEGLIGTDKTGTGDADDPIRLSLARIRQLSAHEVGHALGIHHNFAASSYGRESVMDYPAPLIGIDENGELDFSHTYDVGVGEWDIHSIRYAYSQFPKGVDERAALEEIIQQGTENGLVYLRDDDTRQPGASDPRSNVWDNGADAVDSLELAWRIRRLALERFGAHNLPAGRPYDELEAVLVPVYFHHRYALDAAVKTIGGLEYNHVVHGDGHWIQRPVSEERQRRALEVILDLLDPSALDMPESILGLLAPRPVTEDRSRELFVDVATAPAFDALGAAATAAGQIVGALLEPHRLARLIDFHRRALGSPGAHEVLDALLDRAFTKRELPLREQAIQQEIQRVVVDHLIHLASGAVPPRVRATLEYALRRADRYLLPSTGDPSVSAHRQLLRDNIARYLNRRELAPHPPSWQVAPLPPGSPIGSVQTSPHFGGESAGWSPSCSLSSGSLW